MKFSPQQLFSPSETHLYLVSMCYEEHFKIGVFYFDIVNKKVKRLNLDSDTIENLSKPLL